MLPGNPNRRGQAAVVGGWIHTPSDSLIHALTHSVSHELTFVLTHTDILSHVYPWHDQQELNTSRHQ